MPVKSLRGVKWGGLDKAPVNANLFEEFLARRGKNKLTLELDLEDALFIASCQSGFGDAVDLVLAAVASKRHIFVFGDYDVDGMTSASIWLRLLRALGASAEALIPSRADGYGLSMKAVERAAESGAGLLICVDSGTDRVKEIERSTELGLQSLVVDHHLPKGGRPEASRPTVLLNGHFSVDPTMSKLCAAGQSFALASAVLDQNASGLPAGVVESLRRHLLQFAMVGTISDMMDIGPGFNRAVVKAGLEELRCDPVPCLRALLCSMFKDRDEKIGASTISFGLGPAINSAGRFSSPSIALGLLLSETVAEAQQFAATLVELNDGRRELQSAMFDKAMLGVDRSRRIAAFVGEDWEKGLVGLVASGLVDALQRPALAATSKGGMIYGSGRSVPGFDLGTAVIAAQKRGLLVAGGGHAAACGFQCTPEDWDAFVAFVEAEMLQSDDAPGSQVDLMIGSGALNVAEVEAFSELAPYGQGWAQPILGVACRLHDVAVIGKNKDTVRVHAGFKGIAFRATHNGLMKLLESRGRDAIIIGEPVISVFGGSSSAELRIRDVVVL
ncbi:MAG: hypothetical protein DI537_05365 [Stutzerimonas stutzeri]|nr:MAG: hypothetical protein DI537_05365 [Stutzerimonas stutzeri]